MDERIEKMKAAFEARVKSEPEKSIPEMADELARETVRGMYKDRKLTPHGKRMAKFIDRALPDEKVDEWGWDISRKERAVIKRRAAEKKAAEEKKKAEARARAAYRRRQRPSRRKAAGNDGKRNVRQTKNAIDMTICNRTAI